MKAERQHFLIKSNNPPVVEFDIHARSVYVRFKKTKICKTVERPSRTMHVAIDLDENNDVVGIEVVGLDQFQFKHLLKVADVDAPRIKGEEVVYRTTPTSKLAVV